MRLADESSVELSVLNELSYAASKLVRDVCRTQEPHSGSCNPLETVGSLELSPCGLVANSMFNDVFVVDSAPDPHDRASPYSYMDESEVTWVTGDSFLFLEVHALNRKPDGYRVSAT